MQKSTSVLLGLAVLLTACGGKETGIPQRHLHGIVTIPPMVMWEDEPTPRAADPALNNDSEATADGPLSVTHGYYRIRGTSEVPCEPITPEDTTTLCERPAAGPGSGPDGDVDFYRIVANYRGPLVFKARIANGPDGEPLPGDVDIVVTDDEGGEVYGESANNATDVERDEFGNPVLDEDGEEMPILLDERGSTFIDEEKEFLIRVTVNAELEAGPLDYDLIIVGNDPNFHDENLGIEGDYIDIEPGVSENGYQNDFLYQDPYALKVGAFLSSDIDNLGNPVGGTSCEEWHLDAETETFWCPWEMHFLQRVSLETGVLIEGMGDGKDNDCDGRADTGTETTDADGDGYRIVDGDCNDTDPEVGPFRGDTDGDRKDNDCDGWADNGPDDVDDDGDGWCENGRDANGDGVCRGPLEIAGALGGTGDCNDANPDIHPGFGVEIPQNSIDDDCVGGDEVLSPANSDFNPNAPDQFQDHWTDLQELACGSDPQDDSSMPADADEDGYCDSQCLGTVGCPQDWDGDGLHNFLEMECGSDPEVADAALPDFDGDGQCDGLDQDADDDGIEKQTAQDGSDCNDMDPTIHAHRLDDTDQVVLSDFNYDVVNGIDDDCDGIVDENRDWARDGDGFVHDDSYETQDDDGDGYTLALRDCDDSDASMHLGNYELESTTVVSSDFSMVFLFAGDVISLNNTAEVANGRRVTDLIPVDLDTQRVAWALVDTLNDDSAESQYPPRLQPEGLPVLQAWYAKQPEVGKLWFEATDADGAEIPNDVTMAGFAAGEPIPWAEGHFQELGEAAAAGKTNELRGEISSIVVNTWDGDNDAFHLTFPEAGYVAVSLDWKASGSDYDSYWYCYYFDEVNAPNYYRIPFEPELADYSQPEEGTTIVPLPDGSDCWFFVVGYSGGTGEYTVEITPQGND